MNLNDLAGEVINAAEHDQINLIKLVADRLDYQIRGQALCAAAN